MGLFCILSGWSCASGLQFSQLTPPYSVFGTTKLQKPLDYLNTMKMTIIQKELTQLQKDNASVVSFSQPTEISGFSLSEFETSSQGVNYISSHTVLNEHLHFAVSVPQKSGRTVFCNNCFHNGRNCGGKHTLTTPFSRTKKSVFPSLFTTSPYIQQTVLKSIYCVFNSPDNRATTYGT
ncbi:uncharacterized protein LOC143243726 [Tachypleus tridentatus]|uniref:uncharacterized protein LOC143243726 n=1 Tax=Tachypleus tridentatus TaxID=6853 RepID=UPI003FD61425